MRNILIVLFLLISTFSFGQSKHKAKAPVKKTSHAAPKKSSVAVKKTSTNSLNTTVSVSENTFDFGYVTEGEYVKHRVLIRNTGSKPLQISDISAPCVTADYFFEPIAPGNSSYIDVTFSTEGKVGEQYREVMINGNIENKEIATIYIKGVVYPRK
jgi:hypothetical protein